MIDARMLRTPTIAVLITIGLGDGAVAHGQPASVRGATQQAAPRNLHTLALDPQPVAIACRASAQAPIEVVDISTGTTAYTFRTVNFAPTQPGGRTWPIRAALLATFTGFTKLLSPRASWIWVIPPTQQQSLGSGWYNYELTFTIPTCSIPFTSVQFAGRFAAHDFAVVTLDGQNIASSGGPPDNGHVDRGVTRFAGSVPNAAPGQHVLRFAVRNPTGGTGALVVQGDLGFQ
jgi:hypothetical protein